MKKIALVRYNGRGSASEAFGMGEVEEGRLRRWCLTTAAMWSPEGGGRRWRSMTVVVVRMREEGRVKEKGREKNVKG